MGAFWTGSTGAGWSLAARQKGDGLFVLCQGHPEYGTLSLLREYRRDVRRSLFGRGAVPYPRLPAGYLGEEAIDKLTEFERKAYATHMDPRELWPTFVEMYRGYDHYKEIATREMPVVVLEPRS